MIKQAESTGRHRVLALAIGALTMAAAMAGCGQSSAAPSHTDHSKGKSRTPVGHVTQVTLSGAPATNQCLTSDLKAGFGGTFVEASGQDQLALVYTNISRAPCVISGFPGFELLSSGSDQMTYSPPRQGIPGSPDLLAPGSSDHALFTYDTGASVCGTDTDTTAWVPVDVATIPPNETTPLTVPWVGGSVDICSDKSVFDSTGASIGPIEPGDAPLVPSSLSLDAAQAAANALFSELGPTNTGSPTWESSGLVDSGTNLWLVIASMPGDDASRTASVAVYRWANSQWVSQAVVSVNGLPFLDGGVAEGSIVTVFLTGSPDPDFIVHGNGADWESTSVISDIGGSWHALSFDSPGSSTVVPFGIVTGNVIWGESDLCGCATNEPEAYEWFQFANGGFQPTEPLGPTPGCSAQLFTKLSDADGASFWSATALTQKAVPRPVVFASAACDDGWALAEGTAAGKSAIGLFNWQFPTNYNSGDTARWVTQEVGSASAVASDSVSYAIPSDLFQTLARDLGISVPLATTG